MARILIDVRICRYEIGVRMVCWELYGRHGTASVSFVGA